MLACSTRVARDAVIELPEAEALAGRIVGGEGIAAADAATAEPLAKKRCVEVPEPSLDDSFSDLDRLERALDDAPAPHCGVGVLRQLAGALRDDDHRVTVTTMQPEPGWSCPHEIVAVEAGDTTARAFGLAIDVGTTTCVVQLVDLGANRIVGSGADYNGQLKRGLDIISRINYAKKPERREELRILVRGTLNAIVENLCTEHGVSSNEIGNVAVAGNTTMLHLLLGLDPEYIRLEPYTPTVNQAPVLRADEVGLSVAPGASVIFAPGVGSYVGGDITAGLLETELVSESEAVRLYLDVGTNGEVVVGNSEWLMACAASAGPAFEGSGVRCGLRAVPGAIERVRIDPDSGQAHVITIDHARPRGICGSGMIDLLAELLSAGMVDPSGQLVPERGNGRIHPAEDSQKHQAYTIVPASESDTGAPIVLDERDVQNLLRTKAAVYSAAALMLKSLGLDFSVVEEVYVAGGFGRFLDLEQSITIGLLPDLPKERFRYLGNAALAGAQAMLVRRDARAQVCQLADRTTYIELNTDPAYMDEYMAALFLPHTDRSRFPSVTAGRA